MPGILREKILALVKVPTVSVVDCLIRNGVRECEGNISGFMQLY